MFVDKGDSRFAIGGAPNAQTRTRSMMAIPPHHALKETGIIHFSIIAPAAFLGRRGLFCILQVSQKTTEVLSDSVATGETDHSNLRLKVQLYVADVVKGH